MKKSRVLTVILTLSLCASGCAEPFSMFPRASESPDATQEPDFFGNFGQSPEETEEPDTFEATPEPYYTPMPREEKEPEGSMMVSLNGDKIALDYDASPEYSRHEDGYIEASFYSYAANGVIYEVFLTFPDTMKTGDTISQAQDSESSITFFLTNATGEIFAAASQENGNPYPEGSSYTIRFEGVNSDADHFSCSGTFESTLVILDAQYTPAGSYQAFNGSFSFSMDYNAGDKEPSDDDQPSGEEGELPPFGDFQTESPFELSPIPTAAPHIVTPENAQKI